MGDEATTMDLLIGGIVGFIIGGFVGATMNDRSWFRQMDRNREEEKRSAPKELGILYGKIKWYAPLKGYGFITDDQGRDFMFQYTGLPVEERDKEITEGTLVLFRGLITRKGPQADDVRRVAA